MTGDFTKKKVAVYKSKMPVDGDDAADEGGRAEEGAEKLDSGLVHSNNVGDEAYS